MLQIIMDENLRLLIKLGYFSLSAIVFIGFNIPFWSEMRNERSYFSNLIKVIKDKRKGSIPLAVSFCNLLFSALLFIRK